MPGKYDIIKCEECGNVASVLNFGGGVPGCCGQDMVKMEEKTADAATEKHVPIIEKVEGGYDVTVGSTLHPMLENHWIQWIELIIDGNRLFRELKPTDDPKVHFCFCLNCTENTTVIAREYCNLHGLWRGEL